VHLPLPGCDPIPSILHPNPKKREHGMVNAREAPGAECRQLQTMRRMLLAAAILAAILSPSSSLASEDALARLRALDGAWYGAGLSLWIDAERALARVDRQKPFQWEAFNIRNIAGPMIVFSIGERLFVAYLDGDRMSLTSRDRRGEWRLRRAGSP
jgi:hypothetical protein